MYQMVKLSQHRQPHQSAVLFARRSRSHYSSVALASASGVAGDATATMDDGAGARIDGGAGSSSAIQLHSVLKEVDLGEGDDDVGGVAFGSAMDEATVQDVAGGPSNL